MWRILCLHVNDRKQEPYQFPENPGQGRNEYRFNQDSLDYLAVHKGAEKLTQRLSIRDGLVINTQDPEKVFFDKLGYLNAIEMRLMIEAGLFASLIEHGCTS